MGKSVLVIESEQISAERMSTALHGAGYAPVVTGSVMHGLILARESRPALVVTESNLPDGTGLDVVTRLFAADIPVMIVSDRADVASKVALLKAGAADYLVKPFDTREFLARVTVRLYDRRAGEAWAELTAGDLVLDVERCLVLFRGQELRLTERERDVLRELMRDPGRVFTYQQLLVRVWGDGTPLNSVKSNLLAVTVSNIRRKLREAEAFGYLKTVRGIGYALRERA